MADISDFCDSSKLYSIQNKVNKPCILNLKSRDDFIISWNRKDSRKHRNHSRLIHSFLFKRWTPACMHLLRLPIEMYVLILSSHQVIYIFYIYFYVRRMGRKMVPRVKDNSKNRFTGFRWRVGSWGPPEKLQNFTDHVY